MLKKLLHVTRRTCHSIRIRIVSACDSHLLHAIVVQLYVIPWPRGIIEYPMPTILTSCRDCVRDLTTFHATLQMSANNLTNTPIYGVTNFT